MRRRQTESAKLMVEAQLQETGQQLMECEALLVAAGQRQKPDKGPAKQARAGDSASKTLLTDIHGAESNG